MDPKQILDEANNKMQTAVRHFEDDLKKIRTGRANASVLDGVVVEAYGTQMPLNQVASIAAPEAQLLQITPFDPANLAAISTAIRENQSLGLNPSDDGRVVRVPIPPLTEERRRELAKQLGSKVEDAMIALRQTRHEAMRRADQSKKDKLIGENEQLRLEKQIDESMAQFKNQLDSLAKAKEQEILTL